MHERGCNNSMMKGKRSALLLHLVFGFSLIELACKKRVLLSDEQHTSSRQEKWELGWRPSCLTHCGEHTILTRKAWYDFRALQLGQNAHALGLQGLQSLGDLVSREHAGTCEITQHLEGCMHSQLQSATCLQQNLQSTCSSRSTSQGM